MTEINKLLNRLRKHMPADEALDVLARAIRYGKGQGSRPVVPEAGLVIDAAVRVGEAARAVSEGKAPHKTARVIRIREGGRQ